jgi:hypothetical protein
MNRMLLFTALLLGLFLNAAALPLTDRCSGPLFLDGGGPRIALLGRMQGELTKAQCATLTTVELMGCVASPRVTEVRLYTTGPAGQVLVLRSASAVLSTAMRQHLAELREGSTFRLEVVAYDGSMKLDVPSASFKVVAVGR